MGQFSVKIMGLTGSVLSENQHLISVATSQAVFSGGNDVIYGGDGQDVLFGDFGLIESSATILIDNITFGSDIIYGGEGTDYIFGDMHETGGNGILITTDVGAADYLFQ
jgi:Ca2+-binding RTX toxin-like protein